MFDAQYDRIRQEIAWEDEHIKSRMGWSLLIQVALFTVITQKEITSNTFINLQVFGITVSIASLISIAGAYWMLWFYHFRMLRSMNISPIKKKNYPQLIRPKPPIILGLAGPLIVQIAVLCVWIELKYPISNPDKEKIETKKPLSANTSNVCK